MFKEINKKKFEKIMEGLYQKEVWIQLVLPITNVHLYYPEFDFDVLINEKYHFGTEEIDSVHMSFEININEVVGIRRCSISPIDNGEQIILDMIDESEIIIEHNV